MLTSILVTYATRFGSTEEVANAISRTLREAGSYVDCLPMAEVDSFDAYQAVLLGSAVNYAHWLPNAVDFVRTNQHALNQVPVALFTVHIQNTADDAMSKRNRLAYLDEIRPYLNPVAEGYFAGRFNRLAATELLPHWLAWIVPNIDFRKWDKIRIWANSLPTLLLQQDQMKGDNHVTINIITSS